MPGRFAFYTSWETPKWSTTLCYLEDSLGPGVAPELGTVHLLLPQYKVCCTDSVSSNG